MAFNHGTAAKIVLDGFEATCVLNDVSESGDIDTADTTTLCRTAKTYIPGLEDATVSMSGFLDTNDIADTLSFSYKVESILRTIVPYAYMPRGSAFADPVHFGRGFLTSAGIATSIDDAASIELEFQVSGGAERGISLHALSPTENANGNTASVDNTTSSAFGSSALLSVTSVSGTTPALVVKVQHSVDNSVWVDLITFGSKNSVSAEYATSAGTVNRYVRVLWTMTGTSPVFAFNVAFNRKTA